MIKLSLLLLLTLFSYSSVGLSERIHAAVEEEASKTYCLILDSEISGTVNYYNTQKNESVAYDFVVNGSSVNTSGKCHRFHANATVEVLEIRFLPNDLNISATEAKQLWKIKLEFGPSKDQTFQITDYELEAIYYEQFNSSVPKMLYEMAEGSELEWGASETHGFSCSKSSLGLTNSSSIQFANLNVIAFAKAKNSTFPTGYLFEQCKLDQRTSDLIPIIVGACLAGLVIIVLVAYLVGRARAKRQGYASV